MKCISPISMLQRQCRYHAGKTAICDASGDGFTYGDLLHQSAGLANALALKFNVKKGDRVAYLSENRNETILWFYACCRLGATLVPMNFRLAHPEWNYLLRNCEPTLFVKHESFSSFQSESVPTLIVKETAPFGDLDVTNTTELVTPLHDDDPLLILYTSGTTGAPKGALITNSMIFWNAINTQMRLGMTAKDHTVGFLPFFHTGGWNVLLLPLLYAGGSLTLLNTFDPDQVLDCSERHKSTILFGVPTTLNMLRLCESFPHVDLSLVRFAIVGGEPMPLSLIDTWHDKGVPIRQGYGLTEFGPNVFSLDAEFAKTKQGSIGLPNPLIEAKIVDDHDHDVSGSGQGELWLRGPVATLGYWRDEKKTADLFSGEWLRTGDIVARDNDGFYYVVGRKKDMYISGGENVYPAEIEQILAKRNDVTESAVVGVSDTKWGEVGYAFVVAVNTASQQTLTAYCQEYLAKFKIPKYFHVLDELPKLASGKVDKQSLRALARSRFDGTTGDNLSN